MVTASRPFVPFVVIAIFWLMARRSEAAPRSDTQGIFRAQRHDARIIFIALVALWTLFWSCCPIFMVVEASIRPCGR